MTSGTQKWLKRHLIDSQILNFQKKSLKEHTSVLILYTLLTFILTYPVVFKIRNYIPGSGDAFQWIRILWYTPVAIFNSGLTKLTHDYFIFYPYGIPASPFQSAFNQLLSYVLSSIMEIHVAYTILWLFSFIFGAYGTYLLVRYLTGDRTSSFIAGIVFAFSPYHFVHALGHFGATSIEWIPFCALYLMKMFKEGGVRNSFFAGIFFILVAMSDLQYMVFMGIFVMLLFVYEIYVFLRIEKIGYKEMLKRILYKYTLFGFVSFIGIIPLTFENILTATSSNNFLKLNPSETVRYSADLLSFFIPSVLHPVFGNITTAIYNNFSGNISENTMFIGYAVILLSLFAVHRLKGNKYVKFWLIAALSFSIISLGPLLHVNGKTSFTEFNTTVPLPYLVLYNLIPFLDNCRTTGRFFVIGSLSFAVLMGYGASELLKSNRITNNRINKRVAAIVITSLIIFEYLAVPVSLSTVDEPSFYKEISQDRDSYALLEIPATKDYVAGSTIIYYQTIHGKPVIGNWAARYPSTARNFELNTPVVRELTYLQPFTDDILDQDIDKVGTSILNYYNISYIVLHTNYMNDREIDFTEKLIQTNLDAERKTYEQDSLIVYHVKKEPLKSFMILKGGWNSLEKFDLEPTRWISNNATISICSNSSRNATLNFNACSFHRPRTLEVYNGKVLQDRQTISTVFSRTSIPISLKKGENLILLHVPEGSEIPSEIPELKSEDSRELSIAVQQVQLT
ncbi:hypothetical protein MSBRW_2828 [Methanosarcina barkeri str. Wiesmoor]|uniref:Glycosyltransferase RgtA/B/C/D-like domain-containing protein n=2 Tax=Methanosarcina barkeri TaxID=2208 RepID=A0A0E3LLY5_METBA|nr:hypothetical protein [Methanosarcina barkeri]AKB52081.1 hypothetical protein MSBRW_2828 [Methanosarcina barkeri str. Wiesmoor]